jgi:hypothetical protein
MARVDIQTQRRPILPRAEVAPAADRVVGRRQIGARAHILGDPHRAPPHALLLGVLHRNMNTIMLPKQFHINTLNFYKNIVISASQN